MQPSPRRPRRARRWRTGGRAGARGPDAPGGDCPLWCQAASCIAANCSRLPGACSCRCPARHGRVRRHQRPDRTPPQHTAPERPRGLGLVTSVHSSFPVTSSKCSEEERVTSLRNTCVTAASPAEGRGAAGRGRPGAAPCSRNCRWSRSRASRHGRSCRSLAVSGAHGRAQRGAAARRSASRSSPRPSGSDDEPRTTSRTRTRAGSGESARTRCSCSARVLGTRRRGRLGSPRPVSTATRKRRPDEWPGTPRSKGREGGRGHGRAHHVYWTLPVSARPPHGATG